MSRKTDAREAVRKLWATVPEFKEGACRRKKCFQCCGPVMMLPVEYGMIKRFLSRMSRAELRRRRAERTPDPATGAVALTCPLLDKDGECLVYPVRPLVCRMQGVHEDLRCPYVKVAEKNLMKDSRELREYREIARLFPLAKLVK